MRFCLGDRVRIIGTKCTGVIVKTRRIINNETGETKAAYYISWHDPYGPERQDIVFRADQLELCDPPKLPIDKCWVMRYTVSIEQSEGRDEMNAKEWAEQAVQDKSIGAWGAIAYIAAKTAGVPENQINEAVDLLRAARSVKITPEEGRARALKMAQDLAARKAAQKTARKARQVRNQANW